MNEVYDYLMLYLRLAFEFALTYGTEKEKEEARAKVKAMLEFGRDRIEVILADMDSLEAWVLVFAHKLGCDLSPLVCKHSYHELCPDCGTPKWVGEDHWCASERALQSRISRAQYRHRKAQEEAEIQAGLDMVCDDCGKYPCACVEDYCPYCRQVGCRCEEMYPDLYGDDRDERDRCPQCGEWGCSCDYVGTNVGGDKGGFVIYDSTG